MCPWHFPQVGSKSIVKANTGAATGQTPSYFEPDLARVAGYFSTLKTLHCSQT